MAIEPGKKVAATHRLASIVVGPGNIDLPAVETLLGTMICFPFNFPVIILKSEAFRNSLKGKKND